MIQRLKQNKLYYLFLFLILAVSFILFLSFAPNAQLQLATVVLAACCYIGFGLFHHHLRGDVTAKVVIEYVLIGALGITIVFFYLK